MLSTTLKQENGYSLDRLHDYQHRAIDFIQRTQNCALWIDMGLGKTVVALTAISQLLHTFDVHKVLIIAPLRVATHTWPREIAHWEHTRSLKYSVACGATLYRTRECARLSDVTIINREQVPWLVDYWGKKWPYDMVVIDESSSFKSPRSRRFRALRRIGARISRMVHLTGTPTSNGLLDLWAQIYLLDHGARLGRSFTSYRDTYFVSDYLGYSWTPRPAASTQIYAKLRDICLRLSAGDYLSLPPRVTNIVHVDLPTQVRARYRELEKQFLLSLAADITVEASNAAVLTGKLLQYTSGALYVDDSGRTWAEEHTAKLDALGDVIDASAGAAILVAYAFRSDEARIKARYKQAVSITEPHAIDAWNAGRVPLLLAHPASAGHGLNLQHGGNIIVWFGLTWSLELDQQFNARLHRQGQTRPTIIHRIVARDTIDETVLAALAGKYETQRDLLNALRCSITARVS